MRILPLLLLSSLSWATGTVTAVTNVKGSMVNVTIQDLSAKGMYSNCVNLTDYTHVWKISDQVNTSVNMDASVYTLNDLSTAALAICITRTAL